ncbi:MAG: MFS transporter [Proteobacteria bacterium]|nr:MFS transporter [Pseudomonadota bacterium]
MAEPDSARSPIETLVIGIVAAVQFVNIVDFMMVMPLGPDFAMDLGIRVSHLGVVSGSYTLAAAVSGLICSFFIDRMDRKTALLWSMIGLAAGTAAGAYAYDFRSLLWARVLAGVFGGPATSVAMALIGDVVPHQRRGKALGTVMIAFSLASTFGVPLGLELARIGTWQTPFLVVAGAGVFVSMLIYFKLPSMTGHRTTLIRVPVLESHRQLLQQPTVLLSYALIFCLMMSGFLIFPNLASFVQLNLHFPREEMSRLYLVGGLVSFAVMRYCGSLVDRYGSAPLFIVGSVGFLVGLVGGFIGNPPLFGAYTIFVVFMFFGTVRNISANTLSSKVPRPEERAGFMSLQSAVQHTATAGGGILSSRLLTTAPSGQLDGIESIVYASGFMLLLATVAIVFLQRKVKMREH